MHSELPTLIQVFLGVYILWSFMETLMKTRHPAGVLPFYLLMAWYIVIFYTVIDYQVYALTLLYRDIAWLHGLGIAGFVAGSVMRYFVVRAVKQHADPDTPIESGFFAKVRHPLFSAYLIQLVGIVLCFGSWGGFFGIMIIAIPLMLLSMRELDTFLPMEGEEHFITYRARVKRRVIPGIW